MSVDFKRPEVAAKEASWRMVRDAVKGSESVKAGGYLLPVNPHDDSKENESRNESRLGGAVYFNATGRTLSALVGIAFGKWPEVELPDSLAYLLSDVDGGEVGIINQAQDVVSEVLQVARAGLLVDYPSLPNEASRRDESEQGVRPTITTYPAESIRNWRTISRGSRRPLGLVVLSETVEEWSGFERKTIDQRRVLMLGRLSTDAETAADRYVVQVWRKGAGGWAIHEEHAPVDSTGRPWDVIPFTFIGATNNDPAPDQAPLYDLADLNLAHFRNSADHEESLFFAGQAQVWVIGGDEQWAKEMSEMGVYVGSRAIGVVPAGGDVKMMQAEPVSALAAELDRKVELMASLGARLVTPGMVSKTATQSASEDKASNSVLSLVCDNVSDAYRKALEWCKRFVGETGDTDFTIATEFSGMQFDPQQMAQALAAVQGGMLPQSDFWSWCRSVGLIEATKDDETIRDELEGGGRALPLDEVE